jgi:hypothetical protein
VYKLKAQPSEKISPGSIAKPSNKISNKELIAFLRTKFFGPLKRHLKDYLPYLRLANKRFAQPGRRIPIPGKPLWSEFCRKELGVHIRTVQLWLAGDKSKPPATKFRDKYDSADIAHLERVAWAAQKLAEDNPNDEAFEPIRLALAQRPSGLFVRNGGIERLKRNKYYEGNKVDGKHYWLTPADTWEDLQKRFPGIWDCCPYPRPEGYDALKVPWRKFTWCNCPFGTTVDENGKKTGWTAWARKAIEEQAKGNTIIMPYPMDFGFHLLLNAGAEMRSIGAVKWVAIEDGSAQPSGRNIVEFILRGKKAV